LKYRPVVARWCRCKIFPKCCPDGLMPTWVLISTFKGFNDQSVDSKKFFNGAVNWDTVDPATYWLTI
jgi:hypothetical protein